MSVATKWNRLDQFIFATENLLKQFNESIRDIDSDSAEVSAEMTAAETEYIRSENEKYKIKETPSALLECDNAFICPSCRKQIPDSILFNIKYCPECGKRVIRRTWMIERG
ncbi:MAG: hypothetical protein NC318_04960 [Blautia sp.]|nr:hypothetical protein [Lachnoclostridium sp.]MCM1210932.1 hypothetical protein [Blautia sp.]